MENSKIAYRSSSAKIDQIVCKLDISQATHRPLKITDNEYFRALKIHQSSRTPAKGSELQEKALYYMDKFIRDRLKKGSFGYDNSRVLILRQDLKENSQVLNDSSLFMQKLKQENHCKSAGITHNDWLRQKNAAERIKNKLKIKLQREKTEEMLRQEQIEEENFYESQIEVKKWLQKKEREARKSVKSKNREKREKEFEKNEKGKKAEDAYRDWLRSKIKNETIEFEKRRKQAKIDRRRNNEEKLKKAEFRLKCEQAYEEWVEKVKAGRGCVSRKSSLGKRKLGSEQLSYYLSI